MNKSNFVNNNSLKVSDVAAWNGNAKARDHDLGSGRDRNYDLLCDHVAGLVELAWPTDPPSEAIDIGCGIGKLTNRLRRTGRVVLGIDPSKSSIDIACRRYGAHYSVADAQDHLLAVGPSRYDLALLVMVGHCTSDIDNLIRASAALVATGGKIVLTIPHPSRYLQHKPYFPSLEGFDYHREQRFVVPFKVRHGDVHPLPVAYYHRPLGRYFAAMSDAGMQVVELIEPATSEHDALSDVLTVVAQQGGTKRLY